MTDGDSKNDVLSGDVSVRVVATLALLMGVGSGSYNVFTAGDGHSALEVRDVRIAALEKHVERLEELVDRIDREGPTSGNKEYAVTLRELDRRLDKLEKGK